MGLDQWLCKRPLGSEEEKRIYWRKSNQIHGWFDRQCGEVMNCKVYDISYAQLKELKDSILINNNIIEGMKCLVGIKVSLNNIL